MTSLALRFVAAVNCVLLFSYLVVDSFRSSRFAEVEDWGLFLLFMLTLGRGPA